MTKIKKLTINKKYNILIFIFLLFILGGFACDSFGQKTPGAFCEKNQYRDNFLIDIYPKFTNNINEVPVLKITLPATIYRFKHKSHTDYSFHKGVYVEKVYSRNGNIELEFDNYSCQLSKMNLWERIKFTIEFKITAPKSSQFEGACYTKNGKELWIEISNDKYSGEIN